MSNTNVVWLTDVTPVTPTRTIDPYTTHRQESWRWALLSNKNAPLGDLEGAGAGTLEFNVNSTIRGGGNLNWDSKGDMPDWLKVRLQPWYVFRTAEAEITWPLGVFIPASPATAYSDTGYSVDIELYDKLLILDQDCTDATFTVPAGANVTTTVRNIIRAAGETLMVMEDSTETLKSPMVWEIGTTRLRIVNDLLAAINYFSVWCDGYGAYHVEPYYSPQTRAVVRTFTDGEASIYLPDFTHERDTFNIPNKVIQVARSDGEEPALVSVATNMDPTSPYSYPSRGRWLTHPDTDVEATSQAVLDSIAVRRLGQLQQVSSSFDITHALVPLELNDVVRFQQGPNGINVLAVVQTMSISTEVGALVRTTLKEVVQ